MVADLRGSYVQAKDQCDGKAENARAAQDGVDADEEPRGDAPGQFLGRGSDAEKREDGKDGAAVNPVVMDWRSAFGWSCGDLVRRSALPTG